MNHLLRGLAPISDTGWKAIEEEAKPRLSTYLAARKLVDFGGPHGWTHSATSLGRVDFVDGPADGVSAATRRVLPLVELRSDFVVSRDELADADRGAEDLEFPELDAAAARIAVAENTAVFYGYGAADLTGIIDRSSHPAIALGEEVRAYPGRVSEAINRLLGSGIGGPYGLAVSPAAYTEILETSESGDLLMDHLAKIVGGPVVRTSGLTGAVVVSQRGGDFAFECGQDISIGYLSHNENEVRLYFEESFTFRVIEPDAAIVLTA
ncbi:MAG: family 1 encapsulin nanocompartment shell protein [Acidimicrobiales bacterium]